MCNSLLVLKYLVIAFAYFHLASPKVVSTEYLKNCNEVLKNGTTESGFYYIQPQDYPDPFLVYCNMDSSGGGWTTILNRVDGSQPFNQDWKTYKFGFGNLAGEFWLGLEKIHYLTKYEIHELLFELVDWDDVEADAHYDYFSIGNEDEGYDLKLLAGFSGAAGDCFSDLAGMKFSTEDVDNDAVSTSDCAYYANGGWWFKDCKSGNPTGSYYHGGNSSGSESALYWDTFHPDHYSLKELRMMIRPKE